MRNVKTDYFMGIVWHYKGKKSDNPLSASVYQPHLIDNEYRVLFFCAGDTMWTRRKHYGSFKRAMRAAHLWVTLNS
jgi:hypothetical protein